MLTKDRVEWHYAKIEDFAILTKGKTPARVRTEFYAPEGLPWVKIENLKRRMVDDSEEYLSPEGEMQGRTVPAGSVLLSVNRTIGRVGIAAVPLQTNEQIVAITCREPDKILPEYLYFYLLFSEKILQRRAYVTINSRIGVGMLRNTIVPIAPLEYQWRCVERLRPLEELVWKKEDMFLKLKKYRAVVQKGTVKAHVTKMQDNSSQIKELDELAKLLEQSLQLAKRLLRAALEQIFVEAEKRKEEVYYGSTQKKWLDIDEMWQLDERIKQVLKEMSFFQQCLYRAFYSADVPSAIHTILKQVKQAEPSLDTRHIQDAVAAVEIFRQMGLLVQQENRKLYYTVEKNREDEITREDGSNLTISLWGCTFPNQTGEEQMTVREGI